MTELLKSKYGNNFLTVAQQKADSLDKTGLWRRESSFEGGESALNIFISSVKDTIKNKYPSINLKNKRVIVCFDIESNGIVSNPKIIRGGINAEVDRLICELILKMPQWIPSYDCGKPIRSKLSIPLNF